MTVHEWMRIETHRKDEGPCRRESFHKGMKPRTIFLNNLLLTDPQSPSSSSQNYMTVWFHLLTSPLVITSCQIGFLYSALATSSGSDLKKTKTTTKTLNKRKTKQKKNKTVHQIVNDSSIVPSFGQGHVHVYRFTIDDIYILTGRSERETIACSLYKCRILSDSFFINFRCLTLYVMPSKSRPSCSRTKTNSEIFHIRLEQISPVFIIVISVNVAVALQPEHW